MRHRDTCQFVKSSDVDFRQILDESWTNVPFQSSAVNKILYAIRNEVHEIKNKIFKLRGLKDIQSEKQKKY